MRECISNICQLFVIVVDKKASSSYFYFWARYREQSRAFCLHLIDSAQSRATCALDLAFGGGWRLAAGRVRMADEASQGRNAHWPACKKNGGSGLFLKPHVTPHLA